jgi:hypothetical protein
LDGFLGDDEELNMTDDILQGGHTQGTTNYSKGRHSGTIAYAI